MTINESYFFISLLIGIGYLQTSLTELIFFSRFSRAATYDLSPEMVGSRKLSALLVGSNKPLLPFVILAKIISVGLLLFFLFYSSIPFYLPLLLVLFDQLGFFRFQLLGRSETPLQRVALITMAIHLFANNETISGIGLIFISLQLSLAYFASGYQKRKDPKWRNGTAIYSFSKRYLHNTSLFPFLTRNLRFLKLVSYSVVLFELIFFTSLLSPEIAIILFCFGALFHIGISATSGINGFLWTFIGCYPAIFYISHVVQNHLIAAF